MTFYSFFAAVLCGIEILAHARLQRVRLMKYEGRSRQALEKRTSA